VTRRQRIDDLTQLALPEQPVRVAVTGGGSRRLTRGQADTSPAHFGLRATPKVG
jgi:hypothetical protein